MDLAVRVTKRTHIGAVKMIPVWDRIWEPLQTIYYAVVYKYLVGLSVGIICLAAIWFIRDPAYPLWPVQIQTSTVLLAILFPATAVLYLMANLRTRIDEIQDAARRFELHSVYFKQFEKSEAERKFEHFLLRRFSEYYNPYELAAFSLIASIVAFLIQQLLVQQAGTRTVPFDTSKVQVSANLFVAGFFGALCGSLLLIVKKYRSFDIYPSTYLHAAVALIVGTAAGAALSGIVSTDYLAFVIFAVGFFTATHLSFFADFLRERLAKVAGVSVPPAIPTDLDQVVRNSDAIESLNALSLNSIGEFVKAEPLVLYLNLPQPMGVINGWLDEALLYYYLPNRLGALREANVVRFTQLVELAASQIEEGVITWNDNSAVITGDQALDARLLLTVRSVVESKQHHRLFGVIWEKYRCAFFLNDVLAVGQQS